MDKSQSTPSKAQIARFLQAFDLLDQFESKQHYMRGYGAFGDGWQLPDPAVVDVVGWLRNCARMSDEPDSDTTRWRPIETAPRAELDQDDIWIWAARRGQKLPMLTTWDAEDCRWYTFNLALEAGHRIHDPGWTWQPDLWMPVQEIPQ